MKFCDNCGNFLNISKNDYYVNLVIDYDTIVDDIKNGVFTNKQQIEKYMDTEHYKNLSNEDKKEIEKKNNTAGGALYICRSCKFVKQIPPGTLMYKIKTNDTVAINPLVMKNKIYDTTLPHTSMYVCRNDKCLTHKNPEKRDAVFYSINGGNKRWFTCTLCTEFWSNLV